MSVLAKKLLPDAPLNLVKALQPKFLAIEVRAKGRQFRWAFPLWALEQSLTAALKGARLASHLPPGVLRKSKLSAYLFYIKGNSWADLQALLAEGWGLLELPPGEAFTSVETEDFSFTLKPI